MRVVGAVLAAGRKGTASAAISLLTTLLTAHGPNPAVRINWPRGVWIQQVGWALISRQ